MSYTPGPWKAHKMESLKEFLAAQEKGGHGWLIEHDTMVSRRFTGDDNLNHAFLAGYYSALVRDLLDIIPPKLLRDAIKAIEDAQADGN